MGVFSGCKWLGSPPLIIWKGSHVARSLGDLKPWLLTTYQSSDDPPVDNEFLLYPYNPCMVGIFTIYLRIHKCLLIFILNGSVNISYMDAVGYELSTGWTKAIVHQQHGILCVCDCLFVVSYWCFNGCFEPLSLPNPFTGVATALAMLVVCQGGWTDSMAVCETGCPWEFSEPNQSTNSMVWITKI